MNLIIWLVFVLVLVLEGLGLMFYLKVWKKMIFVMINLFDNILCCFGGGFVVVGVVVYYMLRKMIG